MKTKAARNPGEDLDFDAYCPQFVMTHRDFTADLVADGKELTPDEYLEHCLKHKPKAKPAVNDTVDRIRKYFKNRSCFVFPAPTAGKKIRKLGSLLDSDIDEDFVEESNRFVNFVMNRCEPKTMQNGKPFYGRIIGEMLKIYVESIQLGDVPCIEGALERIAINENDLALTKAVGIFRIRVQKCTLPMEPSVLEEVVKEARSQALDYFNKHVFSDENVELNQRFLGTIESFTEQLTEMNLKSSEKTCKAVLKELDHTIAQKLNSCSYFKIGGHNEYLADTEKLKNDYCMKRGLGEMKMICLENHMTSKQQMSDMIEKMDQTLLEDHRRSYRVAAEHQELLTSLKQERLESRKLKREMDAKIQEINFRMEAMEIQKNQEINEVRKQLLQQRTEKCGMQFQEEWTDMQYENIIRHDHRKQKLDEKRKAEYNYMEREGRTRQAEQLKAEDKKMTQEHEEEKKVKMGFIEKITSKFFGKKKKNP